MATWKPLRRLYYSSIFKNSVYYFTYWLLILVIHHIFISTAAFFHFQLGHRIGTIEEWIFDKGWQIILLSKTLSCWLILKFISIKSDERNPLRNIFTKGFRLPDREIFVFSLFFLLISIIIGVPKRGDLLNLLLVKPIISYMGVLLFFLLDIFVYNSLKSIHPFSKVERGLSYLGFPFIFFIFSKLILLYGLDISFKLYLIALVSFFLSDWRGINWTTPAFFLMTCIAPLAAIFGQDPVWKGSFTPLVFSTPLDSINLSVIVAIALSYFFYKSRTDESRLY